MKIEHLAIWTENIEVMCNFYMKYFGMQSNNMYINEKKGFCSYFLSWEDETTRIEIMSQDGKITSLLGGVALRSIGRGQSAIHIRLPLPFLPTEERGL